MIEQPFGAQLVAGDTWSWLGIDLSSVGIGYTPPTYTLKLAFRGPQSLDLTATTSPTGPTYDVKATPTQTAALNPATYIWSMAVFDASNNRTEIDRGYVEVIADVFAENTDGAGVDPRSWVKRALDQVRDSILTYSGRIDQEYTIGNRTLRCKTLTDLLNLEGILTWRYKRELIASGQLPPATNEVHASFGDASDPILQRLWKNFPGSSA